mmetsp:Transcript_606/g.1964  ORF Transcript_606/g.1964 Transcript_606/m.1964 type:complete len:246 (-) Transcript_606:790-1527(-)
MQELVREIILSSTRTRIHPNAAYARNAAVIFSLSASSNESPPSMNHGGPSRIVSTIQRMPAPIKYSIAAFATPCFVSSKADKIPWKRSHPPTTLHITPKESKAAVPLRVARSGGVRIRKYLSSTSPPSRTLSTIIGIRSFAHCARKPSPLQVNISRAGRMAASGLPPSIMHCRILCSVALDKVTCLTLRTNSPSAAQTARSALTHSPTPGTASSCQQRTTCSKASTPRTKHWVFTHFSAIEDATT